MGSRHSFFLANKTWEGALAFFEEYLRQGSPCRLTDEYPLVFQPQQIDHFMIMEEGGKIQAGLATLEREIEISPDQKARALFIGSVVTAPEFRHQGHQRELFRQVEFRAREWDIDFLVLWSNQLEFYQRLGFFLGGLQASWFFPQDRTAPPFPVTHAVKVEASRLTELSQKHFEAYAKRPMIVQRSFDEMKRLWRIPQMTIASTENAYALMGKGEDFVNVVHEWAGPADEVLACFSALHRLQANVRILTPGVLHSPDDTLVVQALENEGFENRLEYLGLFKLISPRFRPEDFQPETLVYPFFIWGLDSI